MKLNGRRVNVVILEHAALVPAKFNLMPGKVVRVVILLLILLRIIRTVRDFSRRLKCSRGRLRANRLKCLRKTDAFNLELPT